MRRLLPLLLLICLLPARPAFAQSFGAGDIIAAVNALRASHGLAPYTVDSGLMAFALEHSQYQASIGQSTHTHSDGNSPGAHGVTENIASGSVEFMTVDLIISRIWADSVHMNTMIGYETGSVGAGVAVSAGNVYVTLNVRRGAGSGVSPAGTALAVAPVSTQIALVALVTAAPDPNGAVIHVVGYGQSLWSIAIAYGVKIDDLRNLNGLVAGSTDIYAGQRLLVRPAGSAPASVRTGETPASSPTLATLAQPSTAAPAAPAAPAASALLPPTAAPTLAPTLSPTPLPAPNSTRRPFAPIEDLNPRRLLAIALIAVGLIGLLVFLFKSFRR